ncbi:MAG TPA: cell division protein ZapA [Bryobacteraceae bacterium]|nr:cell division protein ZapA [Bryobacteraceae bacterium]
MTRQPVRVHIFNQIYTLLADDDPTEVVSIANQVDELMASIANRTASGDSTRVAVMACLHLADQLRQAEKKLQHFEDKSEQIASLIEETLLHGEEERIEEDRSASS